MSQARSRNFVINPVDLQESQISTIKNAKLRKLLMDIRNEVYSTRAKIDFVEISFKLKWSPERIGGSITR